MGKRFNIRMALEADEPVLEVDKEAAFTPEEKALREKAAVTEAELAEDKEKSTENKESDTPSEDDTSEDKPVEATETDLEDTQSSNADLVESKNENDDEAKSVTDAVETSEALEAIADILSSTMELGGINKHSAKVLSTSLPALYSRVGVKYNAANYPALESFDSYSARKRNTQLAIENINDVINRIWGAVIETISRLADRIKEMASKLVFMCRTYNSQIQVLRSNLSSLTENAECDSKFQNKVDIKNLTYSGKFNPITSLNIIGETFSGIVKNLDEGCKNNLNSIKKAFAQAAFGENVVVVPRLNTLPDNVFNGLQRVPHSVSAEYSDLYTFTNLPAGIAIKAILPKEELSDTEYLQAIKDTEVEVTTDGIVKGLMDEVNCFSKSDIAKLIDQCQLTVNKSTELFEIVLSVINGQDFKILQDIIDHFKSEQKARSESTKIKDYIVEDDRQVLDAKKVITSYIRVIDKLYLSSAINVATICNRVISSGINYSDFCIRKYK